MSDTVHHGVTDSPAQTLLAVSRSLLGIAISSIERAAGPVTVTQHRVLVLLSERGALSVSEIALLTGVNQSNASRLVDRLQRLGLVIRSRAESDGRVVRVALTEDGVAVLAAVNVVREQQIKQVLARLTPEESEAVISSLAVFATAARQYEQQQLEESRPSADGGARPR